MRQGHGGHGHDNKHGHHGDHHRDTHGHGHALNVSRPESVSHKDSSKKPKPWCASTSRKIEWSYEITSTVLGRGTFGVTKLAVARATDNNDPAIHIWTPKIGEECALKEVLKVQCKQPQKDPDYKTLMKSELEVFKKLTPHQGFPKLYDLFEDKEKVYFVMEYCRGGELADAVHKKGSLREKDAAYIFFQVLKAVAHMHASGYVHRDIKPQNFLLAQEVPADDVEEAWSNVRVCCADFGLATPIQEDDLLEDCCGTLSFMSPEQLSGNKYKGQPADVWACGCILYILLSGKLPFDGPNGKIVQTKIRGAMLTFQPEETWKAVSDDAKDLIQKLMMLDWQHRMTSTEALDHPWFEACHACDGIDKHESSFDPLMVAQLNQEKKWGKLKKAAQHHLATMLSKRLMEELPEDFDMDSDDPSTPKDSEPATPKAGDDEQPPSPASATPKRSRSAMFFLSDRERLSEKLVEFRDEYAKMDGEDAVIQDIEGAQLMISMKHLGFRLDDIGIDDLVKGLDTSMEDLNQHHAHLTRTLKAHLAEYIEALDKVFRVLDEDNDDCISSEEMRSALFKEDSEEDEKRMQAILDSANLDSEGNLDYKEFLNEFKKCCE
mmetsp:Transcript_9982/g.11602  ORF Transcript_9982/g.11602 Transcript_9982/m.11602 type:complete len:606 (+) Transcript_9982:103-1920(+)